MNATNGSRYLGGLFHGLLEREPTRGLPLTVLIGNGDATGPPSEGEA